MVSEDEGAD